MSRSSSTRDSQGVGRSGAMWATDHFPFEPDLIAAAKALRVGATVGRSDRFPDEKNRLGSTWGGGDIVETRGIQLVERVAAEGV